MQKKIKVLELRKLIGLIVLLMKNNIFFDKFMVSSEISIL